MGIWLLSLRPRGAEVDRHAVVVAVFPGTGDRDLSGRRWHRGSDSRAARPAIWAGCSCSRRRWSSRYLDRASCAGEASIHGTFAIGLLGGILAVTAYGLVLYAKTIAPIGVVSAVRESRASSSPRSLA